LTAVIVSGPARLVLGVLITQLHLLVEVWQRAAFGTSTWIAGRVLKMTIDRMLLRLRRHIEVA